MHLEQTKLPKACQRAESREHLDLEDLPRRIRDVAILRGLGYSYREIGERLHVTPQAISIMLQRHRRKLKVLGPNTELHRLSSRALNVLGRYGVSSPDEALAKGILQVLERERNCGIKTIQEITDWINGAHGKPKH